MDPSQGALLFILQQTIPFITDVETLCEIFDIVGNRFYKKVSLSVSPHHLLGHAFENGHLQMLIWMERHSLHEVFSNYITLYFPYNHLYIMDHFIAKGYQFRISQPDLLFAINRRDETTLDWIERNTDLHIAWSEPVFHCAWPRADEKVANSFVIAWLQRNAERNEFLSNRKVRTMRSFRRQEPSMNVTWQGYIEETLDLQKRNVEIWYHPPVQCQGILNDFIQAGIYLS